MNAPLHAALAIDFITPCLIEESAVTFQLTSEKAYDKPLRMQFIFNGLQKAGRDVTEERIDGPAHYGGKDNPYEAIKVIKDWGLGFCSGNAVKYILRAGRKPGIDAKEDLQKAHWYLCRAKHGQDADYAWRGLAVLDVARAHGLHDHLLSALDAIYRYEYGCASRLVAMELK